MFGVELETSLKAPVNEGDKIGKIIVKIEDKIIYEIDILAANNIRKKGVGDYFIELIRKFFEP